MNSRHHTLQSRAIPVTFGIGEKKAHKKKDCMIKTIIDIYKTILILNFHRNSFFKKFL